MRRRAVLGAALACLALVAGCDAGGFEPEVWRAEKGNYDGDSRRAAMLSDLLDARLKAGASRDDVLALLGPPDAGTETTLTYYLGRSRYGVDHETLEIAFDADNRLTTAAMRRS